MIFLDFVEIILMKVLEVLEKLTGIPDRIIFGCIIFILFVLSLAAIVFLARKKFNILFKATLIIFCAFILFVTGFIGLIMTDGYRIKWGAESFVQDTILAFNKGKLPPLSSNITEEERTQVSTLLNNLPRENYKIEFSDSFYGLWEFYIHFENGKTFFCVVDSPGTFMRLFARTEYKLYHFREIEKIQGKEY